MSVNLWQDKTEDPDIYSLRFHLGGHYRYEVNGAVVCDQPQLLLSPGTHLEGLTENPAKLFLDLGRRAVERALGAGPAPDVGLRSLDSATGARLRIIAVTAAVQAEQLPPGLRMKFLRNFQNLASSVLADLLREMCPAPHRTDPMIGRRKVAALSAWAELDHDEPITVGDLAAHCGLGIRALQKNFLRHFDTTPHLYLRHLRLDKVRRLLQDTTAHWTVTAAAMEAGFVHLGRFSLCYRKRFGELPLATLARTRNS